MTGLKDKKETENWNDFLKILEDRLPGFVKPWLMSLEPSSSLFEQSANELFLIKSSQSFGIQVLQQKHLKEIETALEEVTGIKRGVRFILDETLKAKKKPKLTTEQKAHETTAIKLENLSQMHSFCGLDLKYTFENFVVGENSKFAYNIAKMIAENPGQRKFNPLFLSGSVGLGKTHLMQAIGHKILRNFPNLKIRYTKAEEFTNKLIEILHTCKNTGELNERMRKFRDMHRSVDILLIDDIQFIEGKKRTQEEIFSTFEALHNAGKQIIFASDRPLSAFETLPDRLESRFKWGVEANITVPDYNTRVEIVKNYAKYSNFPVSDEVAELLAEEYSSNIRELEGAYNKASTMASIEGVDLTVENTKEFLNLNNKKKKITVGDILEVVAKYFSVDKKDILSTARAKDVVKARKYAMYLSREVLDLSYPVLAKEFQKNHTTVMYQCDKLKQDISSNKSMQIVKDELTELITK